MAELVVNRKRSCVDHAIALEHEAGDAAECSNILILFGYGLPQLINLDGAGLLGELARMNDAARMRMEGPEQCRGKASRRAQARAGRDISQCRDFDLHGIERELLE
jgi:hypothetical protein